MIRDQSQKIYKDLSLIIVNTGETLTIGFICLGGCIVVSVLVIALFWCKDEGK